MIDLIKVKSVFYFWLKKLKYEWVETGWARFYIIISFVNILSCLVTIISGSE